jgi:hypothetical protein
LDTKPFMKKLLNTALLPFLLIQLCIGQGTGRIQRAYAFYSVVLPGNIPVGDDGKPLPVRPEINRFIILEYPGSKSPEVDKVLYNNTPMRFTIRRTSENPWISGKRFGNGQEIKLTPHKGNSFWMINLLPGEEKTLPGEGVKNIVIRSRFRSGSYRFNLFNETKLESLPAY